MLSIKNTYLPQIIPVFTILFLIINLSPTYSTTAPDPPNPHQSLNVDSITSLSMRLQRKSLQASSLTDQTFPMLASITVQDLDLSYRAPLDLICVLDNSGSMNGEKINLVKNTFRYLLHFLNDFDRLSIVIFDHEASILFPLINATEANKPKILASVNTVYARGGTVINNGLRTALEILKKRDLANQVTGIFLLSDGLDNLGQETAKNIIKNTFEKSGLKDSVVIHTFGFGRDHDPELMTDIADLTDGNFYFIDQLDFIDEAFVESLGALQTSIAENVQFLMRPEQSEVLNGVEIVKAYGDSAMWTKKGQAYITKTTNLITGRQKDFVLEIKIPKITGEFLRGERNVKIASMETVMTLADGSHVIKKADLVVRLIGEGEAFDNKEEDDKEVMKNYYRVRGAELMLEARRLADLGRYEEGKQILKDFKESVENSAVREEEFIKNMVKDIEKAMGYVGREAYGEYGRQNLIGNQRAQMRQQSNLDMNVHLTNTHIKYIREVLDEL